MKIGLYFGSFNPIHTGHLIIATHIINNTSLDQVWFVLTPQNPLKVQKDLLNEYHRKHLIDVAIEGDNKLKVSTVEFSLPKPSYTVDTLAYLSHQYIDNQFVIIMGSDSYTNLEKWKNYQVILDNYEILVYNRPDGKEVNRRTEKTIILDAPLIDISSTMVRKMIEKKQSIRYLVPDVVKEEIEKGHYYRNIKTPSR